MTPDLGSRVKALRRQVGLSQEELASRIGVSRATIQNIENGRTEPRPGTVRRIAQALGTTMTGLTSDEPEDEVLQDLLQARRLLIEAMRSDDIVTMRELLADVLAVIGRVSHPEHGQEIG